MVSLRLYKRHYDCPTNAALLLVGKDPRRFMPGAYVQYVFWGGMDNASQILNQRIFEGNLCTLLPQLDTFIDMAIVQKRPRPPVNPPVNLPDNLRLVLEEIRRNPQITYDGLAMATHKHRDTIRGYMKRLRTDFHLIERVGSDKNGHWRILTGEAEGKADGTESIPQKTEDNQ